MNDYDKLKSVFQEIGVDFEENDVPEGMSREYNGEIYMNQSLILENGIGYFNFSCEFYFLDGKYQGHGVWE